MRPTLFIAAAFALLAASAQAAPVSLHAPDDDGLLLLVRDLDINLDRRAEANSAQDQALQKRVGPKGIMAISLGLATAMGATVGGMIYCMKTEKKFCPKY